MPKPGTGEVISEARTVDLLSSRAQTPAAGRFRGSRSRRAGGRALEPAAAARGRSAGRAGWGGEGAGAAAAAARPGACARTSHSAARGRPLASRAGGRPEPSAPPPHAGSPQECAQRVSAVGCSAPSRPREPRDEDRAAAAHRVDALPLPQPSPPPPERAAASDRRLRRGGPHGGQAVPHGGQGGRRRS